jgi:hypothetical protein
MRQPWLQPPASPAPPGVPDDFSPRSATRSAAGVALAFGIAMLLLAAGRSAEIVDAAYGLPLAPGTETLIVLTEGWDGLMQAIGVTEGVEALRAILSAGR